MATTFPNSLDTVVNSYTDSSQMLGIHAPLHDKLADIVNALQAAMLMVVSTKTGNYTATMADDVILVDATSGSVTITLPTVVGWVKARPLWIKKIDSSANMVVVATTSSQLVDEQTTQTITLQFQALGVVTNQTKWYIV